MGELIVEIADMKIAKGTQTLATYALGSCVGICLYDEVSGIGGMLHAMLPDSRSTELIKNPYKYVDSGLKLLYRNLLRMGADRKELKAKLAGGAKMFEYNAVQKFADIGTANVVMVKRLLSMWRIPVVAEATGGCVGRTIRFCVENGDVEVHATDGSVHTM